MKINAMLELSCCIHIFQEHENYTTNRKCWKYYLVSEQVFFKIAVKEIYNPTRVRL